MTDLIHPSLFDADQYGAGTPPRNAATKPEPVVEAHEEPWLLIRRSSGVVPYFHLPKAHNGVGSVITCCGLTGTPITNAGVDQMVRCGECDVAAQVHQLDFAL